MKGKYPFLFLLVNWWLWFLNCLPIFAFISSTECFFCKWCCKPVFLSYIWSEDFCHLFIQNNTPNLLDLESWNVIDLNSLLGPCSVRANVLVFLFELKLALEEIGGVHLRETKVCACPFSCRVFPISPFAFKFLSFSGWNFELYLETYFSGYTNSSCSRFHVWWIEYIRFFLYSIMTLIFTPFYFFKQARIRKR